MEKVTQHPYDMQLIPARLFTVNRAYQREAQAKEISDIVSNFDYHLIRPVKAVKRDGMYYVWDGQQTATALYQKFGPEYLVPCLVYNDISSSKEEASLLVRGNTGTGGGKKLTPNQVWDAILWSDDPTALKINSIVNSHGYYMGYSKRQKNTCAIKAVDAVQRSYKALTQDQFSTVFRVIRGAWGDDPDGVSANIISGLTRFIKVYDGRFDEQNLIRRLSKHPPVEIIRNGRASFCKGDAKWAREILEVYNNGTRTNRLPDLFA